MVCSSFLAETSLVLESGQCSPPGTTWEYFSPFVPLKGLLQGLSGPGVRSSLTFLQNSAVNPSGCGLFLVVSF